MKTLLMVILTSMVLVGCECKGKSNKTHVEYQVICSDGFGTDWVDKLNTIRVPKIENNHVIYYAGDNAMFYKIEEDVVCTVGIRRSNGDYKQKY